MVAFYGRKAISQAGLLHEEGIQASQAIASIPTWMGYPATWRVQCVSVSKASETVTACKRLERENWRQAHWELQNIFSTLRLNSTLSAAARPFQLQTTSGSTLVADPPQDHPLPGRSARVSPVTRVAIGASMERGLPIPHYTTDDEGVSTDTPPREGHLVGDIQVGETEAATVAATQTIPTSPE